jgi:hypothetical protein
MIPLAGKVSTATRNGAVTTGAGSERLRDKLGVLHALNKTTDMTPIKPVAKVVSEMF